MNKTKKIVSSIAAVAMLTSVLCFGASAARTQSGAVAGYATAGSCLVTREAGSASTSYALNGAGDVYVDATYIQAPLNGGTTQSQYKEKVSATGGSVQIGYTPNNGWVSLSISAHHRVSRSGQTWTAVTSHDGSK